MDRDWSAYCHGPLTMSPLAYLVAAIMRFRRNHLPTHGMSEAGYAALAISVALAFYYNGFRLFAFRVRLVNEGAVKYLTMFDTPAVMFTALALIFVGLTLFYGQDRRTSEMLRKFEKLSVTQQTLVNVGAALFLSAPIFWLVLEVFFE